MYFCRSCFEGAALYLCQGSAFFECCLCSRKYTPEEVRGPFSVVTGGSGNVMQKGRPFGTQDHCLNPWCDSLTWAFVDDPAPGHTHRMCCKCRSDWPEVPQTADRCFWCHETRTIEQAHGGKTRLECFSCRREWLHPDAPKPLVVKAEECREELPNGCRPPKFARLTMPGALDLIAGYSPPKDPPKTGPFGAYLSPQRWCPDDPSLAPFPEPWGWRHRY